MTDLEMLELAAKAADLHVKVASNSGRGLKVHGNCNWWDPLTDDGDALRLAVKMGIYVHCRAGSMVTSAIGDGDEWVIENWSNDPTSATRRAITRAAAQIGKEME